MQYQFFAIPARDPESAQRELNQFLAGHRVSTLEKIFVANGDDSYWSICINYIDSGENRYKTVKSRIDYREVLNEKDFAVYAKLRDLRKSLSEQEGVPAYALFTNEQLAKMVQERVVTLNRLQDIDGVGKAKVDKYGAAFLQVIKEALNHQSK